MVVTEIPASTWCLSEVEIFRDLSRAEMDAMATQAPMRTVEAGSVVYSPLQPIEVLFILKRGRVRLYRLASDGRVLTTAILERGTVFGQMDLLGQRMGSTWAEALEPSVLCLMSREDVASMLLGDPRIALRIAQALGRRLAEMEHRLSETVFKSAPARVAATLLRLAREPAGLSRSVGRRSPEVRLTHEQLAAIVGMTRETTTKVLGELRGDGLVTLRRGRITLLDTAGLERTADEPC